MSDHATCVCGGESVPKSQVRDHGPTMPHASLVDHNSVPATALAAAPLLRRWLGRGHHIGANFGAAHPHTRSAQRQLCQLSRQRVVALDVARALQRRSAPSDRALLVAAYVLAQRLVVALR